MTDMRGMYDEIILDHNRAPRNVKVVDPATAHADGNNPLCGDALSLTLRREGDVIADIGIAFPHNKKGCAISTASASLMTTAVKGKTVAEAEALFQAFHEMITAPDGTPIDEKKLGKLAALAGARKFASRTKCASLAWHTLHAALQNTPDPVTTE